MQIICIYCVQASALGPPEPKLQTARAMACSAPEDEPWLQSSQAIEMINLRPSQAHMGESSEGHLSCMRCGTFCEQETMRMQRRWAITHDGVVCCAHANPPSTGSLARIVPTSTSTRPQHKSAGIPKIATAMRTRSIPWMKKSKSWNTGSKNSRTNGWMSLIACVTLKRIMNSLSCNSRCRLSMRHGRACPVPCGCTSLVDPAFRRLTKNNH